MKGGQKGRVWSMKGGRNIGEVGKGKGRLKVERSVRGEVQRIVKGR